LACTLTAEGCGPLVLQRLVVVPTTVGTHLEAGMPLLASLCRKGPAGCSQLCRFCAIEEMF